MISLMPLVRGLLPQFRIGNRPAVMRLRGFARHPEQFTILDDAKVRDLSEHIAPITPALDDDDEAKRFDNFMYGLILMAMSAW